ncbi:hypothetical protein BDV30DRAFT_19134 [Aspergillus minisclerotigenes]|uniref:Invertebrate defensins family profile domain-containing protein n=1 Tax=Aspergillus minisclerotigenes TaxID=656917 RepID=A0A5N6ISH0_9EURO|nr:hypothetical protein BDV30DRAFT_19134 [Aspergillus minisclerotigenes]
MCSQTLLLTGRWQVRFEVYKYVALFSGMLIGLAMFTSISTNLNKMKLLTVAFSLLLLGQVNASPLVLDKRTSCQVGGIDKLGAADAACSASCAIQHGDKHGGHCDKNKYVIYKIRALAYLMASRVCICN